MLGRPSSYSESLAEQICERVANGESLYKLCDETKGFPGHTTVFRWLQEYPSFRDKYARAKEIQAERSAEEMLVIADDLTEDANSRRVRVDTRKWLLSKLIPKKYGDATLLKHGDPEGNKLEITVTRVNKKT